MVDQEPLGAIGIMLFGERVLDHGVRSIYGYRDIREKQGIPHVGERVRNRHSRAVHNPSLKPVNHHIPYPIA
ncbi:MAG: hypothetical protein JRC68_04075 [Deltaproteobacteria bacterium]|nr:hypothetical protein [Deltaproteobacteria bacterium]